MRTRSKIRELIAQQSRAPFESVLSAALAAQPTQSAWRAFAAKRPHQWAAAVRSLGELAGYSTGRAGADAADVLSELANLVEVLDNRSGNVRRLELAPGDVLDAVVVEPSPTVPAPIDKVSCESTDAAPAELGDDGWPV